MGQFGDAAQRATPLREHLEDGAREGAAFVCDHIIRVQERGFDAGMQAGADRARNRKILGLGDAG